MNNMQDNHTIIIEEIKRILIGYTYFYETEDGLMTKNDDSLSDEAIEKIATTLLSKLHLEEGIVIAEGEVIIPDNYCGVVSIRIDSIDGAKTFTFNDDLPNKIIPLEGKKGKLIWKEE